MDRITSRDKLHYTDPVTGDQLSTLPTVPKDMLFDLTNGCNHACYFCNNPHQQRKISRMPKDVGFRVMKEAVDAGVEEIGFYNTGDPFVSTDLEAFVEEANRLGYKYIYVTTNGALAMPDRAKKVIDAGLDSIKFSINAGSRETYKTVHGKDDWDAVIAHLEWISEYRKTLDRPFYLAVSYVQTRLTESEAPAFKERFSDLVDEIVVYECHDQVGQMAGTEELLAANHLPPRNEMYSGICSSPFKRAHITSEGFMTLCCVEYENYAAVEDMRDMSFLDAWHSQRFQATRKKHIDGDLSGTICDGCWFGNKADFEPINPALAHKADFQRTLVEQVDLARERLTAHEEK